MTATLLLASTRKGLFLAHRRDGAWEFEEPHFPDQQGGFPRHGIHELGEESGDVQRSGSEVQDFSRYSSRSTSARPLTLA